jgi:hypothetical protein
MFFGLIFGIWWREVLGEIYVHGELFILGVFFMLASILPIPLNEEGIRNEAVQKYKKKEESHG